MILSDVVFPNVTFAVSKRGQTPSCGLNRGFLHTESNGSFGMLGQYQPPVSVSLLFGGLSKKHYDIENEYKKLIGGDNKLFFLIPRHQNVFHYETVIM